MARKFLTADEHLGHGNIAVYSNRPWVKPRHLKEDGYTWINEEACLEVSKTMNFNLIHRWNERVSPEDTVYHVGDFCVKGRARGYEGLRRKAEEYEQELNGKIIHILGNHDENNGVKHGLDWAVITFNGYRFLMRHRPFLHWELKEIPQEIDGIICGHVHNKWRYRYSVERDIIQINVGIDVCDYYPLNQGEFIDRFTTYRKKVKDESNI